MSSTGIQFNFGQDCPSVCKFCKLYAGFHALEFDDYYAQSMDYLDGGSQKPVQYYLPTEMGLVQLFFDVFLIQSKFEFLDITLNTVCKMLVSKKLDIRLTCAFLLYLDFVSQLHKEMAALLVAVEFQSYFKDFIAEYMQNFELLSFKDSMADKFEGSIEAMVQGDNKIKVKNIMQPFDDNKDKKKTINARSDPNAPDEQVIDFTKKIIYNDCIWDSNLRRFRFFKIYLTPSNWKLIRNFNQDKDLGYYTYYFWRLHALHHALSIFSSVIANSRSKARAGLLKSLGQLPLQLIEVSVLFKDYSQFFVPRDPFLQGSECWTEIKTMGTEFMGILQKILLLIISKDNALLLKTVSICSRNNQYIGGMLDIMGKLSSLSSTNVLLKNLLLISEEMLMRDPDNIDFIPSDIIKFTVTLIEELKTAHQKVQVIFQKNIELADKSYYFNERALSVSLEFAVLSLQALNVIGIEELLEEKKDTLKLVAPILSFHELTIRTMIAIEAKIEKFRQAGSSMLDYKEFSKKYYQVIPLFFWWVASSSKETCDVSMRNQLIIGSSCFKVYCGRFPSLELPLENKFSMYCVFSYAATFFKKVTPIETRFDGFCDFIVSEICSYKVLSSHQAASSKLEVLYPLLKAVYVLLSNAAFEGIRFMKIKPAVKSIIGEVSLATGEVQKGDDLDFGDLSAIEEAENHFLDPAKYASVTKLLDTKDGA